MKNTKVVPVMRVSPRSRLCYYCGLNFTGQSQLIPVGGGVRRNEYCQPCVEKLK